MAEPCIEIVELKVARRRCVYRAQRVRGDEVLWPPFPEDQPTHDLAAFYADALKELFPGDVVIDRSNRGTRAR